MEITTELIESVCGKLGIEYIEAKEMEGGIYIAEGGVKRKLTEKDFEDIYQRTE